MANKKVDKKSAAGNKTQTTTKSSTSKPSNKTTTTKASTAMKKTATKAATTKAVANKTTKANQNKVSPKASQKANMASTTSEPSATSKSTASKSTASKSTTKPVATAEPKQQKPSSFTATLSLLCSLAALALAGYTFYLTQISSQGNKVDEVIAQIAQVDEKNSNTEELVGVLQEQMATLGEQQSQFVDIEAVEAIVGEKVHILIDELSSKGELSGDSTTTEGAVAVKTDDALNEAADAKNEVTAGSAIESESLESNSSQTVQSEEQPLWSWERAKTDFKAMFSFPDLFSIKKKEESN